MAIVIQNTGVTLPSGEHTYLVKINARVITGFSHHRSKGLAECLRRAAEAVDVQEAKDILDLLEGN